MAELTNNGSQEVELNAKTGLIKIRGSDLLTTFGIAIVCLVGYMVWEHKEDSKTTQQAFIMAVKELTTVNKEMAQGQRTMNCLIATDQKDRESRLSTCERIAR